MTSQTGAAPPNTWVPDVSTFGARLALVRWRLGWNAKEAALACGLPPGSWREWELKGRGPRDFARVSAQIAQRTGVDDYWLMTGKTNGPRPDGPDGGQECAAWDSNPEPTD